jgi:SPP1 family holin
MTNLPFDKGMIIRTVILFAAWFNQYLVVQGYNPLPFDDAGIEMGVSTLFTFGASVWTWWKNNDVTRKARQAAVLAEQKGLK